MASSTTPPAAAAPGGGGGIGHGGGGIGHGGGYCQSEVEARAAPVPAQARAELIRNHDHNGSRWSLRRGLGSASGRSGGRSSSDVAGSAPRDRRGSRGSSSRRSGRNTSSSISSIASRSNRTHRSDIAGVRSRSSGAVSSSTAGAGREVLLLRSSSSQTDDHEGGNELRRSRASSAGTRRGSLARLRGGISDGDGIRRRSSRARRAHAILICWGDRGRRGGRWEEGSYAVVGADQGGNAVVGSEPIGHSRGDGDVSGSHEIFPSRVERGMSRGRSAQVNLEVSVGQPEGAMLPGVEIARRRRGRISDSHDGGHFGCHEHSHSHSSSRSLRTGGTGAHHHHHHHYHVHSQSSRNSSRPGTPRPSSRVRRVQDILHEHHARSPFHQASSSSDRGSAVASSTNPHASHRRSHHGHRSSNSESRASPFSSLWRRSSSEASTNSSSLRGAVLEARNRLDELLRAAAHTNSRSTQLLPASVRRQRSWQPVQTSYDMSVLLSDEDEGDLWSDDDGWETSLHEWLAAWAPSAAEERLSWNETSSGRASSSRNPTCRPRPSEGLSKAAINALPRQVMGLSRGQGSGSKSKMEQEDCPVCLEGFVVGQTLVALPCSHRFHPECLTPWLTNHDQCPYCRAEVVKDVNTASEQKGTSNIIGTSDDDLLSWVETIERGFDRLRYS